MARRKHHGEHHEEHPDESWLIPYADILTLLLALFIVLFASAQVDQKKFDQIAQAFSNAFSSGSPAVFDSSRLAPQSPTLQSESQSQADKLDASDNRQQAYVKETIQLLELKKNLDKYIQENKLTGDLQTVLSEEGLMIRIKDTALFPSGSAELIQESRRFGLPIAQMLVPLQQKVMISGHTDTVPINTREFPSNWDLSSKRAVNFMRFLLAQEGALQPDRFSATGYGEYRPVVANDNSQGRATNRRVEVLIARSFRM